MFKDVHFCEVVIAAQIDERSFYPNRLCDFVRFDRPKRNVGYLYWISMKILCQFFDNLQNSQNTEIDMNDVVPYKLVAVQKLRNIEFWDVGIFCILVS